LIISSLLPGVILLGRRVFCNPADGRSLWQCIFLCDENGKIWGLTPNGIWIFSGMISIGLALSQRLLFSCAEVVKWGGCFGSSFRDDLDLSFGCWRGIDGSFIVIMPCRWRWGIHPDRRAYALRADTAVTALVIVQRIMDRLVIPRDLLSAPSWLTSLGCEVRTGRLTVALQARRPTGPPLGNGFTNLTQPYIRNRRPTAAPWNRFTIDKALQESERIERSPRKNHIVRSLGRSRVNIWAGQYIIPPATTWPRGASA